MSRINFMLSRVEHEKSFITLSWSVKLLENDGILYAFVLKLIIFYHNILFLLTINWEKTSITPKKF